MEKPTDRAGPTVSLSAMARTGLGRSYLGEGDCPAGAEPVAKVIGALQSDLVEVEPGCVAVVGLGFPKSATAVRDSAGRPFSHVPSGARQVRAGEVWSFGFNAAFAGPPFSYAKWCAAGASDEGGGLGTGRIQGFGGRSDRIAPRQGWCGGRHCCSVRKSRDCGSVRLGRPGVRAEAAFCIDS